MPQPFLPHQASADPTRRRGKAGAERPSGTPTGERGLPHEETRDDQQPYAREVEDYAGRGVVRPPQEKPGGT